MNAWGYVVIIILSIGVFAGILFARGRLMKSLSKLLYNDHQPEEFLTKINGFWGKIFFSKQTRLFQSLDAYFMCEDFEQVENTFKSLESGKLSYGAKINLYEKEVQYYVQNKKYTEAQKANDTLQSLGKQISSPEMDRILLESSTLIKIYVDHDGSVAKDMVALAEQASQKGMKGLYYYRAAKCYNYQSDRANTIKFLEKAQQNLSSSKEWDTHIEKCLKDFSALEEK